MALQGSTPELAGVRIAHIGGWLFPSQVASGARKRVCIRARGLDRCAARSTQRRLECTRGGGANAHPLADESLAVSTVMRSSSVPKEYLMASERSRCASAGRAELEANIGGRLMSSRNVLRWNATAASEAQPATPKMRQSRLGRRRATVILANHSWGCARGAREHAVTSCVESRRQLGQGQERRGNRRLAERFDGDQVEHQELRGPGYHRHSWHRCHSPATTRSGTPRHARYHRHVERFSCPNVAGCEYHEVCWRRESRDGELRQHQHAR